MKNELKIRILKPGLSTTIQGKERIGFGHLGIPQSGPLDASSAAVANLLTGNNPQNSVIESTIIGPNIHLSASATIAISGGTATPSFNKTPIKQNTTIELQESGILKIGRIREGMRSYLAINGDWQLPQVFNSVSPIPGLRTNKLFHFGLDETFTIVKRDQSNIPLDLTYSNTSKSGEIRFSPGPEFRLLSSINKQSLIEKQFTILPESNRMGLKLAEPIAGDIIPSSILSSPVMPGTIQLIPSGQLIILLADSQTIGGYPRIGKVIEEDLSTIAQLKPLVKLQLNLIEL